MAVLTRLVPFPQPLKIRLRVPAPGPPPLDFSPTHSHALGHEQSLAALLGSSGFRVSPAGSDSKADPVFSPDWLIGLLDGEANVASVAFESTVSPSDAVVTINGEPIQCAAPATSGDLCFVVEPSQGPIANMTVQLADQVAKRLAGLSARVLMESSDFQTQTLELVSSQDYSVTWSMVQPLVLSSPLTLTVKFPTLAPWPTSPLNIRPRLYSNEEAVPVGHAFDTIPE